jgi:hypothetical protein
MVNGPLPPRTLERRRLQGKGGAARGSKDDVAHSDGIKRACIAEYWRKF